MRKIAVTRERHRGIREHPIAPRGLQVNTVHFRGLAQVGQGAEHEAINDAEHRRIGADTERERDDDGDREPR